jgi:hypothetical protein
MSKMHPIAVLAEARCGQIKGCLIPVESKQFPIRGGLIQDPRCVTSQTQRSIYMTAPRAWHQRGEHLLVKYR